MPSRAVVREAKHLAVRVCDLLSWRQFIPRCEPAAELHRAVDRARGEIVHPLKLIGDDLPGMVIEPASGEQQIELVDHGRGRAGVGRGEI